MIKTDTQKTEELKMNLTQKSSIRKLVNSRGCRISPDAFDGINRAVESLVDQMLVSVKDDGMKTLMAQHTGTHNHSNNGSGGSCKRCCNIKEQFIQWAKTTQGFCCDQAVILSRKVRG